MIVEIVSIGNEVLRGSIVNTNAAFLGKELLKIGVLVSRQTALPDTPVALKDGLQEAHERADLVITTGGLGSTFDDITREVVADLFGCGFSHREEIAEDLRGRYQNISVSISDQARQPHQAKLLPNAVGTAPGLVFTSNHKKMILLPGVPKEMQHMVHFQVIPYLQKMLGERKVFVEQLHFGGLSESQIDPVLRQIQEKLPLVDMGIYPSHGTMTVSCMAEEEKELAFAAGILESHFGSYRYLSSSGKIEEALHNQLLAKGLTLAFAESCTGGALSAAITSIPGASQYFLGSSVVYANRMKEQLLGVSSHVIEEKGAVSEEVALAMWEGAMRITGADLAIAVSGIAGPLGGTEQKPVGTICAAIGGRGELPDVGTFRCFGDRSAITLSTVNRLLFKLYRKIEYGISCFES